MGGLPTPSSHCCGPQQGSADTGIAVRRDLHPVAQRRDDAGVGLVRDDQIHVGDAESLARQHLLAERLHAVHRALEYLRTVQVNVVVERSGIESIHGGAEAGIENVAAVGVVVQQFR